MGLSCISTIIVVRRSPVARSVARSLGRSLARSITRSLDRSLARSLVRSLTCALFKANTNETKKGAARPKAARATGERRTTLIVETQDF